MLFNSKWKQFSDKFKKTRYFFYLKRVKQGAPQKNILKNF
ncbi:hypothetical protein LMIV_0744 [Listeria monocytogenes FSL J1-208]|nr:hypothetical protein LMIV_0744 [Listeria monocytogenes FSL J1-208]